MSSPTVSTPTTPAAEPIQPNLEKYQKFLEEQVKRLASFDFDPKTLLWHYTSGNGLLGILSSGTLYSTQVSRLNDSSEIRYGQSLFQRALTDALSSYTGDQRVKEFIANYLKLIEAVASQVNPPHAPSPFFVTCFCAEEDDLGSWRTYGQKGYAIAFAAEGLFNPPNPLLKVNYDPNTHKQLAKDVVAATIRFYEEGLAGRTGEQIVQWEKDFVLAWESKVSYLLPLVKDPAFKSESEYRILHEFRAEDFRSIVILQKDTMMTRHVPLAFPRGGEAWVPRLPIEKIMVGPCRHPSITGISVDTMLRKMGYSGGKVVHSVRPLQET
jgi:Protein of unknown function (DUF2971)